MSPSDFVAIVEEVSLHKMTPTHRAELEHRVNTFIDRLGGKFPSDLDTKQWASTFRINLKDMIKLVKATMKKREKQPA